jgi:protein arginine N-methyltransferase 1
MSHVIDEHREYLGDRNRVEAFRRALKAVVRPGDVVLDLASGTGILGLLACQAGAGRVYAVDEGPIVGLARDIAAASPYADRVTVLRTRSTWAELPGPVDVIVTDQIGHFGFEAGLLEYVPEARDKWLRPGGRIVPRSLSHWMAPVEHAEARARVDFWRTPVLGLDMSPVLPAACSSGYPLTVTSEALLATGRRVADCVLAETKGTPFTGGAEFTVEREGRFDGLLGWFRADLAPDVWMTNAPADPDRINRRQTYFPVDPVAVTRGDVICCDIRVIPRAFIVEWSVQVRHAAGQVRHTSRHSTFGGLLVSAEDLRRTANTARPRLSRSGEARLEVLRLCDGRHTVQEIERALAVRFPDLFASTERASAFVAEVLTVYGQ